MFKVSENKRERKMEGREQREEGLVEQKKEEEVDETSRNRERGGEGEPCGPKPWYLDHDRRASGPYCVVSVYRGPEDETLGSIPVESVSSYTSCYDTLLTTMRC